MKKNISAGLLACALSACVQIPETPNEAPVIQLSSSSTEIYPGSSFRVNITASDDNTAPENLEVRWSTSKPEITLLKQEGDYAEFSVGSDITENQNVIVSVSVKDNSGAVENKDIQFSVGSEAFIVLDATSQSLVNSTLKPLYLTGLYSAKQVNLKAEDVEDSENYQINISPDHRYVFFIQKYVSSNWQARIYDSSKNELHVIDLDFNDRDYSHIESYWSNDGEYLAIKMPHVSASALDALYWLNTANLGDSLVIPEKLDVSFDRFLWSDNGDTQPLYASIVSSSRISVLNPQSKSLTLELKERIGVSSGTNFVKVDPQSVSWVDNNLYFMATTLIGSNSKFPLYHWESDSKYANRVNGTTSVDGLLSFDVYDPSNIVYLNTDNLLSYFDGENETQMTFPNMNVLEPGNSSYSWSPDGEKVSAVSTPSNSGNEGKWLLSTWEGDDHYVANVSWVDGADASFNIAAWNWNETSETITILSRDDVAKENVLLVSQTASESDVNVVKEGIQHDESGLPQADNLLSQMIRSPTGRWQLFWGVDASIDSDVSHLDLWRYDTLSGSVVNVSQISNPYLVRASSGRFEQVQGYRNTENALYVASDLIWIDDDHIAVKFRRLTKGNEIVDLHVLDLSGESEPYSLLNSSNEVGGIVEVISF